MRLFTLTVFFLAIASGTAFAQETTNARLSGTVLDPNDAAVPDAKVRLLSAETGLLRTFMTSEIGQYSFTLIPPGRYELRVEKTGFREYVQADLVLAVGQASTLDVKLQIGSASETVRVEASAQLLETGHANLASEVSARQVVELPLNYRNVFALVLLDSSVNNSVQFQSLNTKGTLGTADHDIGFLTFPGGRFGTTGYLVDGHWNTVGDWDAVIYVPSVDELQEFKIEKNTFSPQYGFSSGNVVNAITKSGTRDLHGNVYEFLRNDHLDANSFFNNRNGLDKARFGRNQFGFTLGGPLYIPRLYKQRDRTFFFVDYEGLRDSVSSTILQTVPTDLQRQGDFSKTFNAGGGLQVIYNPFSSRQVGGQYVRDPFAGNVIPAQQIDRISKAFLNYWPQPNRPGALYTGQNNYAATAAPPDRNNLYTIRVDHNITENQRLFARWSYKYQMKTDTASYFGKDNPGGPGFSRPEDKLDAAVAYTWVFSPSLVMSANFGFGRWVEGKDPQGADFKPSSVGLPSFLDNVGGTPTGFPTISVGGMATLGAGAFDHAPRDNRSAALDLTKIKGPHSLTFGFNFIDLQYRDTKASIASFTLPVDFTQGPNPATKDPKTGIGFASYLLGTGSGNVTLQSTPATDKKFLAWYFNDAWKITRNLTVNLGLRYDFQTAPTDRFDRLPWISLTAVNPLAQQTGLNLKGGLVYPGQGNPRGVYDYQKNNFAPRVSIAWHPVSKTVIRSGAGLFYLPAMEQGTYQGLPLTGFSQVTPWVGSIDGYTPTNLMSNPFPTGLIAPTGRSAGLLTAVGQGINGPLRQHPTPYMSMWTLGIQRDLGHDLVLEAAYVGNHGVKLTNWNFDQNQLSPQYMSLGNQLVQLVPNPFYGSAITPGSLSGQMVPYGQLLRPYPQFLGIATAQNPGSSSWYHALMLSANRRFRNGLQVLVSFTASKYLSQYEGWSFDNQTTPMNYYDFSREKSLSTSDIPRSLVASYVYDLPVGKGKALSIKNKFLDGVIGGWEVAGIHTFRSGVPLAFSAAGNTGLLAGGQRPNLVGDPHVAQPSVDRWFNTAAFVQPPPYTFGTMSRTTPYLRSDWFANTDFSLSKNWRFQERWRVQLRADGFNLLNQVNLYLPNANLTSPSFGIITGAFAPRTLQVALKMYW